MGEVISRTTALETPGEGVISLICGIVNIIFPGVGTLVAAALSGCNTADIIIGILQLVFCWLIIGWIWSIVWGILMIIRGI